MVFVAVGAIAPRLAAALESRGWLATGLYRLRFVTHLDVDAGDIAPAPSPRSAEHFNA